MNPKLCAGQRKEQKTFTTQRGNHCNHSPNVSFEEKIAVVLTYAHTQHPKHPIDFVIIKLSPTYIYKRLAVRNSGLMVYSPATCHCPYFLTQFALTVGLMDGYFLNH